MRKVLVIGSCGAGKSTLAAKLAARLGLELIHLDALYWQPGWVETPKAEWTRIIDSLLVRDGWVMDGNYGGTLERRLKACDTVVFLDLPRRVCLMRVLMRRLRYHGRARPDMSAGCPEALSWAFLFWIWRYPQRRRPAILARLAQLRADQRAVVLRSDAEIAQFLNGITPEGDAAQ